MLRKSEDMYTLKPAILYVNIYPTDVCTRHMYRKVITKSFLTDLNWKTQKFPSRTEKINWDILINGILYNNKHE